MAFNLEVEFSGLCLYVVDDANEAVGVLMPDARSTSADANHKDGTEGKPHVGYLRFDLADLSASFPVPEDPRLPKHEGVIQFSGDTLTFRITGAADPIDTSTVLVPELEELAPDSGNPGSSGIKVRDGMFTDAEPDELLMRTILTGGTLVGEAGGDGGGERIFNNLWRPGRPAYKGDFASFVTWSRPVESVVVELQPFAGGDPISFPLVPRDGDGSTVYLKVANLCKTNPLEWENMGEGDPPADDVDFKWIYHLLEPGSGNSWETALLGGHRFPIPLLADGAQGVENCIGMKTNGSTT